MNQSSWDNEDLSSSQNFREQSIVSRQKPYKNRSFDHNPCFGRTRVRVKLTTLFIEILNVFRPGNVSTLPEATVAPLGFDVFSGPFKPEKKSSEETDDLQGNPLMVEGEALRSPTQKSCKGSESDERDGIRKRQRVGRKEKLRRLAMAIENDE